MYNVYTYMIHHCLVLTLFFLYACYCITDLYIVAIDWPGHGLSSPRPAGAYYHLINMVADLKYVVDGEYTVM